MVPKTTDKILIIDDDAGIRKIIKDYLEDGGFEVYEATNGADGLVVFRKEKPDLVITNIQMPVMGGLALLGILAQESPNIPVVVVSDTLMMDEVIEALKLGAWDYLNKPIKDLTILEHTVAKALENSRLVEENRIYRIKLEAANQALKKSLDALEQDQEAGRSVQMRLLPEQNVRFGSYQFSHSVVPSLYLSGDFVNYFKINDTQFGFYIVDVSGHGASSAFVTVLLKSLVSLNLTRYQLHKDQTILQPDKLLSKIGTEIHSANLGKYLTIVYGIIDWQKNTLDYSIGGHYPNPIWIENGQARFMEGKGFPVGIMKDARYETISLPLPGNIQIVMFSDGITEILPESDLPAKEKKILNMASHSDGTAEYFVRQLDLENKHDLPDDVTILVLKKELNKNKEK